MRRPAKASLSLFAACTLFGGGVAADSIPVQILDPNLQVTTVINSGITQPIGIVFLGQNDFLVLEKASGQVKRVINSVIQAAPVLDLAVNSNSERGLLSLVLHPDFPATPVHVRSMDREQHRSRYGRQHRRALARQPGRPFCLEWIDARNRPQHHHAARIADGQHPGTRSSRDLTMPTRKATTTAASCASDPTGSFIFSWETKGRRGWLQNLQNGPFETAPFVDDTFGGPEPDNAHLSGRDPALER